MFGWTSSETISLVVKFGGYTRFEYPQAYVVFGQNKSQLKSAIEWAKPNYKIIENIPNKGFTLEIHNSARGSSQGGKLSFWDCIIGNIPNPEINKVIIGINSEVLASLLLASNFIQGKCNKPLLFASCKGRTCVIHKDMEEYKQLISDNKERVALKNQKVDLVVGNRYETSQLDEVYLGKIYQNLELVATPGQRHSSKHEFTIKVIHDAKPCYFMASMYWLSSMKDSLDKSYNIELNSTTQLIDTISRLVYKQFSSVDTNNLKPQALSTDYGYPWSLFNSQSYKRGKPKRFDRGSWLGADTDSGMTNALIKLRKSLDQYLRVVAAIEKERCRDRTYYTYSLTEYSIDTIVSLVGISFEGEKVNLEQLKYKVLQYVKDHGYDPNCIKFVDIYP